MNIVCYYVSRASFNEVLKKSFEKYDTNRDNNLYVFCSNGDAELAKEWANSLKKYFADVSVEALGVSTAAKDSAVELFTQECFVHIPSRCVNAEAFIVLHPFEVPAKDDWALELLFELRKHNKNIIGVGEEREKDGSVISGTYVVKGDFFRSSSLTKRLIPKDGSLYESLRWVVKQNGKLSSLDEFDALEKVSEAREPIIVSADAFSGLGVGTKEEVEEDKPVAKKKTAKKKGAKKKSAKKATKKTAKPAYQEIAQFTPEVTEDA